MRGLLDCRLERFFLITALLTLTSGDDSTPVKQDGVLDSVSCPEISFTSQDHTNASDKELAYGVDVSFPMHYSNFSNIHRPYGDAQQRVYEEFMQGCRDAYPKYADRCDFYEKERIQINLKQPKSLENYTDTGYKKVRVPKETWKVIKSFWENNQGSEEQELWFRGDITTNNWVAPSYMIDFGDDALKGGGQDVMDQIMEDVRPTLEEWSGNELQATHLYGIGIYTTGSILSPHVDGARRVTSAIINVAQDLDEPWPLEVIDLQGRAQNVTMQPGDMVLYESRTVIHGRPYPLRGKYFANVFLHFEPLGYERDLKEEESEDRAEEEMLAELQEDEWDEEWDDEWEDEWEAEESRHDELDDMQGESEEGKEPSEKDEDFAENDSGNDETKEKREVEDVQWRDRNVGNDSSKAEEANDIEDTVQTFTMEDHGIQRYLNPKLFKDPQVLQEISRRIFKGDIVVIKDAFLPEYAEAIHRDLDRATTWKHHSDYFEGGFQYSHHNIYMREDYSELMNSTLKMFSHRETKNFMVELTGRDCFGRTVGSPSYYMPGDYSMVHNDHLNQRTVAYVWHLSKDWQPEWGGSLYWVPESLSNAHVPASFNTLILFSVRYTSTHFVSTVSPNARQKRLSFNGWWQAGWIPKLEDELDEILDAPENRRDLTAAQFDAIHNILEQRGSEMQPEKRNRLSKIFNELVDEWFPLPETVHTVNL